MARVPVYEPQVQTEATQVSTPQLPGPLEAASGVNIPTAYEGVAQKVGQVSEGLSRLMLYKKRLDDQQAAYDRASGFQQQLQNFVAGPNGLLTKQGADAKGITMGKVEPGFVGPPQTDPNSFDGYSQKLKADYLKGLNATQAKMTDRLMDSHINVMREAVIRHEAQQGNIADKESAEAQVGALNNTATMATSTDQFLGLLKQAQTIRGGLAQRQGMPPDALQAYNQKTADEFAENAVKTNLELDPKKAQDLLDGASGMISNDMKAHLQSMLDGKMLDLTAKSQFDQWSHDPRMQNADGSIDLKKAQDFINGLPSDKYPDVQKEKMFKLVQEQDSNATRILDDQNKANSKAFFAQAGNPQIGLSAAKRMAFQYANRLRNGNLDTTDVLEKQKRIEQLYRAGDSKSDPSTLVSLHEGINDGTVTKDTAINDALEQGLLSKKDAGNLSLMLHSDRIAPIQNELTQIKTDLQSQIPNKSDRDAFMASLLQQKMEQKITDRGSLQKLYQENLKTAPTGEKGFWQSVTGGAGLGQKTQEYYKTAEALQKNQAVVKAMGGTDALYKLSLKMGGPGAFVEGSPASNAILALRSKYQPQEITQPLIEWALKKYPQLNSQKP